MHPFEGQMSLNRVYLDNERRARKWVCDTVVMTLFVVAIWVNNMRYLFRMKLSVVKSFWRHKFIVWVKQYIVESIQVVNWLASFNSESKVMFKQDWLATGGGEDSVEKTAFQWPNTILGNVDLRDTFQVVHSNCAKQFFAEFDCYFNRCYTMKEQITRFVYAVFRTVPRLERSPNFSLA